VIHWISELIPLWIVVDSLLLLLFIPVVIAGKLRRRKEKQKKAWNAAAPMKVPGKLGGLYHHR
jgi:ACR3 family arsenite efflux pump ArsB